MGKQQKKNPFAFVEDKSTAPAKKNPFDFVVDTNLTKPKTGENTAIYGDTKYDEGYLPSYGNMDEYKAQQQGVLDELGNGVARAALKVIPSTVQNLAYMGDIEDYFNGDEVMGNEITRSMDALKGKADEAFPIYGSGKTLDWTNHEWLINQGSNLTESAGAFALTGAITGGVLGRGAQFLGNLAKTSKIPGAIGMGTNAVLLNQAEGKASAVDVYRTIYENKMNEFKMQGGVITPDMEAQAKKLASDAGEHVLAINSIAIPLNLTSAAAFLRTPQLTRQLVKNITTRSTLKHTLLEGGQEYLEENINRIAEQEGLRKGKQGDGYSYDFGNTINDVFSKEGFEAGVLGFVGGVAQTGASSLANRVSGVTQANNDRAEIQRKAIAKRDQLASATGNATMKATLEYAAKQSQLLEDIAKAAATGDTERYNLLNEASLQNQALYHFESGTTQKLEDMYRSIHLDPESVKRYGPDSQVAAEKAIKQIKVWEKKYQDLAVDYSPDVARDIFTTTAYKESVDKAIATKRSSQAELQGKKAGKDIAGVPDTQLDLQLAQAQVELDVLTETSKHLDEQYQEMIKPDYAEKKQAEIVAKAAQEKKEQEKLRKEQEKLAAEQTEAELEEEAELTPEEDSTEEGSDLSFDDATAGTPLQTDNNQTNKDDVSTAPNEVVSEELPKKVKKAPKQKEAEKTVITDMAHKTFEQDPETGKDLRDKDGKRVKSKVSVDLSSPDVAQAGEPLVFYKDTAYSGPETKETPIAIALKSDPSVIIGHVHSEDWIENGVAESAKDQVRAETKAIRDAVMASDSHVEGAVTTKTFNPKAIIRDGNNFTHSLADSFGAQSKVNPNKFGESEIVYVEGKQVFRGDKSAVTDVTLHNIDTTKEGIKMMIPTPVKGTMYLTRLEPQTLKTLGQSKVIVKLIEDYLANKGDLDKLIKDVHNIDAKLEGEEGDVFALTNADGKLQVQYGNSSFEEGEKFDKTALTKYLDAKPLNVDYKRLNSKDQYLTKKIGKDGNVVNDVTHKNYSEYLGLKALKTNITPEITSFDTRVFFAQPNVGIGLKAQPAPTKPKKTTTKAKSAPKETAKAETVPVAKVEEKASEGNSLFDEVVGREGKYAELAKVLKQFVGKTPIQFVEKLKTRGQYTGGRILINPDQDQDQLDETLMHESVHAATVAKIEAYQRGEKLSDSDMKAVKSLERLMQNANKPKRLLTKEESAGFSNLHEFVAMTLTNPNFQKLLNEIPYNKDLSLLDRIFEVLSKLLGIDVKAGSALEQAAKDAMSLVTSRSKGSKAVEAQAVYNLEDFEEDEESEEPKEKKKAFERPSTGDPVTDKYVKLLDNQIRALRDQKTKLNEEETKQKIWALSKYQDTLMATKNVFKIAKDQAVDIKKTLNKKDLNFKDLVDTQDSILGWSAITKLLKAPEGSLRYKTQKEINGEMVELSKKWLEKAKQLMLEESKGKLSRNDLEAAKDINWTESQSLSSDASPVAIEAEMKRLMDTASFRAVEEINQRTKVIKEKFEKFGGKKNIPNILQVNSKGEVTGNLLSEYDADQEQELADLKLDTKAGLERLAEIADVPALTQAAKDAFQKDFDAFTKREEARLKESFKYTDIKKGEGKEKYEKALKSNLDKWERMNSPVLRRKAEKDVLSGKAEEKILKSMKGNQYLSDPTPKKKDPRYNQLSATDREFLDFFKAQMKEYLPYLVLNTNVKDNTLPNLRRSFTEDFMKNPTRALINGSYKKLLDNITVNEDSTMEYGNMDAEGMPIRRLRTRMIGNNLNPNEKSYDLEHVLTSWVTHAAGIKYKSQIEPKVKVAQKILASMQAITGKDDWTGQPHVIEGGLENAQKRFGYTVDAFMYDMRKESEGNIGKIDGKNVTASKGGDAIIKLVQANSLLLNPISGFANWLMGTLTNFVTAAEGVDFTTKGMAKAGAIAMKEMFTPGNKKLHNVLGKLQTLGEVNPANYGGKSILDHGYIFLRKGEEFIQGQLVVAMLDHIKMPDGKTTLWEALDENGEVKPEFADSGYGFGGKATDKTIELSTKIRHIVAKSQGDYDIRNPKLMKKKVLGRALSVFKNWIPRAYQSRWGEKRFDSILGREVKGRYKSIGALKGTNVLANIFALSLLGKMTGAKTNKLSELDERNLKVVARELALISTVYLTTMILKALMLDDDDEEGQAVYQSLLNTAFRIENEMSFWISPSQITEMVKNPMAPIRVVDDAVQFWNATEDFVLGDKEFKDWGKKALKITPAANQILKWDALMNKEFAKNFGTKVLDSNED